MIFIMKLSRIIRLYVQANNLSIEQLSIHTNIPFYKLLPSCTAEFTATELLDFCNYCSISPEVLFQITSLLNY